MTFRKDNPFLKSGTHPTVAVVKDTDPYNGTLEALKAIDLSPANGMRVLVKPNAGRIAKQGSGITTDPRVVAAVIDALKQAGAFVSVGESPITGVDTLAALEASGIAQTARERDCPILDMDQNTFVEVPIPDGIAINSIKVCADVLEHDLVVSVPVMKVHMHTGVTLAVKNMKGCLWRRSKIDLHMLPAIEGINDKSLDVAIADMSSVLKPHLSIIDGTVGMEGLGPSAGTPKPLGVVVAGTDAFAADAAACVLMGINVFDIPHLRIGAERGYGSIDLNNINIQPDAWREFGSHFESAPENLSIEFPNVNVLDKNSCSACQSTVLLFLQRHGHKLFDYFPADTPINIAIGKGHDDLPERTLCIGNCTIAHQSKGLFVPGCPPVASAILNAITSEYKKK
ncbi:MAG: DUF362 domain-containing protein [Kiritimatiellae bacterium]|nr:DUF362 domain-containing protein [Kiritimatiellia bacterium]